MPSKSDNKVLFIASIFAHFTSFHLPSISLLQQKGYQVHVAASPSGGVEKAVLESLGVVCRDIPIARSPYSISNIKAFLQLKKLLTQERFALVHVHTPVAAFLGRGAASLAGDTPVLYTAHGFHFYKGAPYQNWLLYYPLEQIARPWTDGLIVLNKEDYHLAAKMGYKQGENLFYVPGVGVSLDTYSPGVAKELKERLSLKPSDLIITCVAEFNHNKNHRFLLDVWQDLAGQMHNIHLVLVGNGQLKPKMEQRVRTKNIANIHFLGYRTDIPQILKGSDLFVLVSLREGLPRSVMEAMAAGLPVIVSDIRGSRDLVENKVSGLVVHPGDKNSLRAAMLELVADKHKREIMGAAARARIKKFSQAVVLEEISKIYAKYLNMIVFSGHRGKISEQESGV